MLFVSSPTGGNSSAILFSVLASCKRHNVEPETIFEMCCNDLRHLEQAKNYGDYCLTFGSLATNKVMEIIKRIVRRRLAKT